MGLTTAWFHARKPAELFHRHGEEAAKAPRQAADAKALGQAATIDTTSELPWQRKDLMTRDSPTESEESELPLILDPTPFGSPEYLVKQRHEIRLEALELTTLLDLNPSQTESLLAALSDDQDPFGSSQIDPWSKESLTPEQAAIYERRKTSGYRNDAELNALWKVRGYSKVMALSEHQRRELFKTETERNFELLKTHSEDPFRDPSPELLHAGPSMILTSAQYQAYEEFHRRAQEIEESYAEEINAHPGPSLITPPLK